MAQPGGTLTVDPAGESGALAECFDRLVAERPQLRPLATYRLQLHAGFRFEDAQRLAGYLAALGVSHCYLSPITTARTGSAHGYDVTDHNSVNPELGGEEGFRELAGELRVRGLGVLLDFVPNHMGVGQGTNPWWQDVLENGRASEYAEFFDIDWEPLKPELRNRVLLPALGDYYGTELEQGRIQVVYQDGRFGVSYYDKFFRLDPQTIPRIFEPALRARSRPGDAPELLPLEEVLRALSALPAHVSTQEEVVQTRRREVGPAYERLRRLMQESAEVRGLAEEGLRILNGRAGEPLSFDLLHALLEEQAYRLAHWLVSGEEINYRRFFDINDLVGLRIEQPRVFAATHRLVRRLLAEGSVSGLRIDHPDGLFNPRQYFTRLQMLHAAARCCGPEPRGVTAENGIETAVVESFGQHPVQAAAPLYVLVEKILEPGEHLPREWAVDGTTGYEFANLVNGIFVDQRNERAFTQAYHRFLGWSPNPETALYDAKELIMETALASELTVLGHVLDDLSTTDRFARDFTRNTLTDAIRETIACFPVYRTYIDERGEVSERDRAYINKAIALAKRRNQSMSGLIFDFLRDVLLLRQRGDPESHRRRLHFTLKFQQLTGPVMAKGLEDTLFYRYNRFVALNEVGGSPQAFGVGVEDFHAANAERAEHWPNSLLTTSTHDSKRSEDVRARLAVLSEMPKEWSASVQRWRRLNQARKRTLADGRAVPDLNEEYLLYQTLAGTWPWEGHAGNEWSSYVQRIQQYMVKAVHEAKVNLSWINPNPEYVQALEEFIARILGPAERRPNPFPQEMERFVAPLAFFGAINSLSQTLLKITAPGVPDFYQGTELWDFSLVDPDNRRPVDFELRRRMSEELDAAAEVGDLASLCSDLLRGYPDGRVKLWTTTRGLRFRRQHPDLFRRGSYIPLRPEGDHAEHVCGFLRRTESESVLVAAPRLAFTLMGGRAEAPLGEHWAETRLVCDEPLHELENVLTGERLRTVGRSVLCREIFQRFPVALLSAR